MKRCKKCKVGILEKMVNVGDECIYQCCRCDALTSKKREAAQPRVNRDQPSADGSASVQDTTQFDQLVQKI